MRKRIAQAVRTHRRSAPFTRLASVATTYLRLYNNENFWDFDNNGEAFALRGFASWAGSRPLAVWDVGAHDGEWATEAHRYLPHAEVTSFELVPDIAAHLAETAARHPWLTAVHLGLSDREGTVPVHATGGTTSAIAPRPGWYDSTTTPVDCAITTGDAYLARPGVRAPSLLKIDTEGHEAAVLRGCSTLLSGEDAPAMIQFEYGDTYVPSGATLAEVQLHLEAAGYVVGRLYPDHVAFKTYEQADDHFRMGNMIAVRDDSLRQRLAG